MTSTSERVARATWLACCAVLGVSLAGSLVLAWWLPTTTRVPIHFDLNFRADSWMGPPALVFLPLLGIISAAVVYWTTSKQRVPTLVRALLTLSIVGPLSAAQMHVAWSALSGHP